MTGLRMHGD